MSPSILRVLWLLFLLGCVWSPVCGAENLEELMAKFSRSEDLGEKVESSRDIAKFYFMTESDSSLKYAEICLEAARESGVDSLIFLGLNSVGTALLFSRRYQEAVFRFEAELEKGNSVYVKPYILMYLHLGYKGLGMQSESRTYIDRALKDSEQHVASQYRALILFNAGSFYKVLGDFTSAIYYYFQALEIVDLSKDEDFLSIINQNLAGIYEVLGDYDKSLELAKGGLEIARRNKDDYKSIFNLFPIADAQFKLQEYDASLASAREAIEISNRSHITNSIGYAYFQIARVYTEWKSFDSAMYYVDEGIRVCKEGNDLREETDCQMMKARIFLLTKDYQKADSLARAILEIEVYEQLKFDLYEIVAKANEKMGLFATAYEFLEREKNLRDSLEQVDPVFKLTAAVFEREYEQEKERQKQDYNKEVGKWKKLALLIGGTFALLAFLLFVFYRSYLLSTQNSELNKLNRTLEQRNLALQQFTFISSHDLLEPVRVINSMSSLLHRSIDQGDSSKNIERLSYIQSSAKSLKVMTSGLREFTDVLNSMLPVKKFQVTDISLKINEWLHLHSEAIPGEVTWDLENTTIIFPFQQLVNVLQKLIQNSFQANPDIKLQIIISGQKSSGEYLFSVKDNGIGINPAYHEMVFEPFQSLENKMESQRSGLGLSICRLIVENNGGRIWLESKEGKGATVFFTVPRG